jgi:hypothetical protein
MQHLRMIIKASAARFVGGNVDLPPRRGNRIVFGCFSAIVIGVLMTQTRSRTLAVGHSTFAYHDGVG